MTPGEEENARIHEDGIYCPPDMFEEDQEVYETWEKILFTDISLTISCENIWLRFRARRTPEPGTPSIQSLTPEYPLTPGAAKITEEALYETAEDMEDVVDEL